MLTWLIALPCLLSASLAPGALPKEVLDMVISKLGFADLYQLLYVSRDFWTVAHQTITTIYGIQYGGKTYLDYTMIAYELDALVQQAGKDTYTARATMSLRMSPPFMCLEGVLATRFGYRIKYSSMHLPKLDTRKVSLDVLDDMHKISLLPYVIDQKVDHPLWIDFVHGLVSLGRVDILGKVTFSKITQSCFCQLMGIALPESVLLAAARCLENSGTAPDLADWLAWIIRKDQRSPLLENRSIPLSFLGPIRERDIEVPDTCTVTSGLQEFSILFWMSVLEKQLEEARGLLWLVWRQGDYKTKLLASTLYGVVSTANLGDSEVEIYQAVLIRFRFSPLCNRNVVRNYSLMLQRMSKIGRHTIQALLDCGQYGLAGNYILSFDFATLLGPLVDKMYQLGPENCRRLMKFVEQFANAAELLKSLIRWKADNSYIRLVYDLIQATAMPHSIEYYYCCVPLDELRAIMFEPDLSRDHVLGIGGMIKELALCGLVYSKECRALYTAIYWEASENVIDCFLAQVPVERSLHCARVWGLLLLRKYSNKLCKVIIRRCGQLNSDWEAKLREFRPDLAQELNIQS